MVTTSSTFVTTVTELASLVPHTPATFTHRKSCLLGSFLFSHMPCHPCCFAMCCSHRTFLYLLKGGICLVTQQRMTGMSPGCSAKTVFSPLGSISWLKQMKSLKIFPSFLSYAYGCFACLYGCTMYMWCSRRPKAPSDSWSQITVSHREGAGNLTLELWKSGGCF